MTEQSVVVLAGSTGNLGKRIARELRKQDCIVKALIRSGSSQSSISHLKELDITPVQVDFDNHEELTAACRGATCVVSALAGMKDVIVGTQVQLLNAAVAAKVPRFIPSDFSMEYLLLPPGSNRNLSWRREFSEKYLDKAEIQATSILCGPFTDVLTDLAPIMFPKLGMILYWGSNPDVKLDFTTMDDTAAFTALVAIDPDPTPRYLRISGNQLTTSEVAGIVGTSALPKDSIEKSPLRIYNAGSLDTLSTITSMMRRFGSQSTLYPAWVGMEYLHGMYSGLGELNNLDNERYPEVKWTTIQDLIGG